MVYVNLLFALPFSRAPRGELGAFILGEKS